MNKTITIRDINQWIDNDEGLYNWFKAERKTRQQFIQEHKQELMVCIESVISGAKPAHFLAY